MLAFFAGVAIGAAFFGGLWWTVLQGVRTTQTGSPVSRQLPAQDDVRFDRVLSGGDRTFGSPRRVPAWICAGSRSGRAAHPAGNDER